MQRYVFTERELAEAVGMTRAQLRRGYMTDPRYPPKEPKGWPLTKWQTFVALKKEEGKARLRGPNADVRRQKVELECEKLRIEIRKQMGELAEVDEIAQRMTRLHADMALRVGTWRESCIAKHPTLRKDIEAIARQLQAALAEAVT